MSEVPLYATPHHALIRTATNPTLGSVQCKHENRSARTPPLCVKPHSAALERMVLMGVLLKRFLSCNRTDQKKTYLAP